MITLHHCPQTRSMRVLWLLHELDDVDFRVQVHPFDKSLRRPEYLTLSPAGRVPAIDIEGERMFESAAILQYLCERYSPDRLGRSMRSPDRPDWLVWLSFAETISQHVAALTQQHLMLREDWMRSPMVMKLEAARLTKCYDAIEARLSTPVENRDYLLTSGFSAADIAVGQAVYMARCFAALDDHPAVVDWYARITDRPGFKAALPSENQTLFADGFYAPWPVEAPDAG